ncbi:MAG: hypothetical protein HKO96_09140 [Flavobacteriaceae bacterium]|nr:hypothetical protein [Flavobacteriaceae bacterium]NNK70631.1 hypothetical protein [Flavobacteriaceae bacterium]NNL80876.1 hypothetical protein [Flavobacteriaceae bacterium]
MDKFVPKKVKPLILLGLWILIAFLAYKTFMSVYGEIQFNKVKNERYAIVIDNLIDIRDSQLAHRTVTGKFANNWDGLVRFLDTAQFTITQRRDTSILDEEATRRFGGVPTFKDIVVIDTLDFVKVKDSLFGADDRYKTMMNLPVGQTDAKFELKSGVIDQNGLNIPVFEVRAPKKLILNDQDPYLIAKENEVVSVDGVNGDAIKVGSMDEVNTNGNWPKNYSTKE